MKLIVLNPVTKLPEPSPEALLIPDFLEIWTRVKKIDGDRTGEKKLMNLREIGYIYFQGVYDSRLKFITDPVEKFKKVKEILKLPEDWTPDNVIHSAIQIFKDSQITSSTMLVDSIEGSNIDLADWIKSKRTMIKSGSMSPKDVSEVMDIIASIPGVLENTKRAKAVLEKEQENLKTGRGGRKLGLFEVPEEREGGL